MRRFRWIAWTLVWSAWAFLGYQLYRELPRTPTLRLKLAFHRDSYEERVFGATSDGETAVSGVSLPTHLDESGRSLELVNVIRRWDARSGARLNEWKVDFCAGAWSGRHECFLLGNPQSSRDGPTILDVRHGFTHKVECRTAAVSPQTVDFHDIRKWTAFYGSLEGDPVRMPKDDARVLVADLRTGSIIASIPAAGMLPSDNEIHVGAPLFVPDTELLLVGVYDSKRNETELRVYQLPDCRKPLRIFTGVGSDVNPSVARNGRMAVRVPNSCPLAAGVESSSEFVDVVLEVADGRVLMQRQSGQRLLYTHELQFAQDPMLSSDGRTLVQFMAAAVWNVDSKQRLWGWTKNEKDHIAPVFDGESRLETNDRVRSHPLLDYWNQWMGQRMPALSIPPNRHSVFDARTGALVYRCPDSTVDAPMRFGGSETTPGMLIDASGQVYDLPPAPPWLLIAVVQSIAATPLVVVWLWGMQRKRRMKTHQHC